jgi:(1->4)-alpha-D-glucan 1-alpha-D-glucosylmutase
MARNAQVARVSYRVQLSRHFTMKDLVGWIPYLSRLGVTDLYLSPFFRADLEHGYHVLTHNELCPVRCGEKGRHLLAVRKAATAHGMTITMDMVPNHMAPMGHVYEPNSLSEDGIETQQIVREGNPYWHDSGLRERVFDLHQGKIRRFFHYDCIAGVRVEVKAVAENLFQLIRKLIDRGIVDRLRLDYPEGLACPGEFLDWLIDHTNLRADDIDLEVVTDEDHPIWDEWQCAGTVGYEFLGLVHPLFGNDQARPVLEEIYSWVASERGQSEHTDRQLRSMYGSKARTCLSAREAVNVLKRYHARKTYMREVKMLKSYQPQLEAREIRAALCALPRRTYVNPTSGRVSENDRKVILAAQSNGMSARIASILLLEDESLQEAGRSRRRMIRFVKLFQQLTNFVCAWAETTRYWDHNLRVGANDIGLDGNIWRISPETFHQVRKRWIDRFPGHKTGLQTHDTMRSPDARACWEAAMQDPKAYKKAITAFFQANQDLSAEVDRHDEYRIYQELICGGLEAIETPVDENMSRFDRLIIKAIREAGVHGTYKDPNEEYENAILAFVRAIYQNAEFLAVFNPYRQTVKERGRLISESMVVAQHATIGSPDIFWGDEIEGYFLSDPDQRVPVDFDLRERILAGFQAGRLPKPNERKMYAIWKIGQLRKLRPELFITGPYTPVYEYGEDVVAWRLGDDILVVIPTRVNGTKPPPPAGFIDVIEPLHSGVYVREEIVPKGMIGSNLDAHVNGTVAPAHSNDNDVHNGHANGVSTAPHANGVQRNGTVH